MIPIITLTAAAVSFLTTCAPQVNPTTMAGLIRHESDWGVYAIGDNTARRSYNPSNYFDAVTIVLQLQREGHSIDAGLAQINNIANWQRYGLNAYNVFEPCLNVHVGSDILYANYQDAQRRYPAPTDALTHALSEYNTGDFTAGMGYAADVIASARAVRFMQNPVYFVQSQRPQVTLARRSTPKQISAAEARAQVLEWMKPAESLPIRTTGDRL